MMPIGSFLRSLGFLIGAMALLSILETVIPCFRLDLERRRHLGTNVTLTSLTLGLNFVFNAAAVLASAALATRMNGLLSRGALTPFVTAMLAVVLLDASTYVCHRLMHVVPFLWKAHSVHHSDRLVDVTTTLRFHPVETAWRFAFLIVPILVLGIPPEAVAVYRVVSAFTGIFEHMNVKLWPPLDTALSLVMGTPNMHKVHHSRLVTETNTNYGNILSIFDRLFSTFTPSARAGAVRYGLDDFDADSLRLRALFHRPFFTAKPAPKRRAPPISAGAGPV